MKWIGSLIFLLIPAFANAQSAPWDIKKAAWTEQDERAFGQFIASLGAAVERRECDRVDTCLKSSERLSEFKILNYVISAWNNFLEIDFRQNK